MCLFSPCSQHDRTCAVDVPLQIAICDLLWRLTMTSASKIKKKHEFLPRILAHGAPDDNQLIETVCLFMDISKGEEYEMVQLYSSIRNLNALRTGSSKVCERPEPQAPDLLHDFKGRWCTLQGVSHLRAHFPCG